MWITGIMVVVAVVVGVVAWVVKGVESDYDFTGFRFDDDDGW